jgi:p-methyltransferase
LKKYHLDYIIYSFNSEKDLLQLMKMLKIGGDLKTVNNLAYIDHNENYTTSMDCWNEPVLDYPPQAWSQLYSPETMGNTLQLRTTSGCPFSCAFCTYPVTAGGFSLTDVETFERQLQAIHALGNIKSVILIDDTPNVPLPRFRELVEVFKKYPLRWYSFLRVQYMDEQLAMDMAISGCDGVYMGIESANDGVLAAMNKKVKVDDYRRGIELLRRNNIVTFAAFVLGFPGETEETVADNINFIEETGLDFYSVKEFYYSHTASIHEQRKKYGLTGQGNEWKHNTMSSVEASNQKLRMFETVKSSIYVDSDSGLWYLAYLRECGFTWSEIREIQNKISEMMSQDNRDDYFSKDRLTANLVTILGKSRIIGNPTKIFDS